ncbi:hypothetical protein GYMLUDRAFT_207105 [Collybiopsis luxurians FD-317 M1]|uniref:Nephrocystin 3-like N-terminal domain-containing protein n=1 Tax=Collybiopsis luxurians FD-317 M1 TaxID=944289 RepID=A0A0D0C7C6_9AGAR|nr:hypothetical protein GYMLUDRAFT_207105 [Collybiopsis luxurians FD-317 M1]
MDQASGIITDSIGKINESTKSFSLQIMIAIQKDTSFMKRRIEMLHLENWPISHSAWYATDAGLQVPRNKCTDGTRKEILKTIQDWVLETKDNSPPVFWLTGMGGMGKSTIAYSICNYFEKKDKGHRLGASFFCSRQIESLRTRRFIIPTIVQQLAYYSAVFADALSGIKSDMPYVVEKQIDELLIRPWQSCFKKQLSDRLPVLIVIDALDEIEGGQGSTFVSDLIQSLNQAGSGMHGIKFLITSRPEPNIVETWKKLGTEATYRLEDVKPATAVQDVKYFLGDALSQVPRIETGILDRIAMQSQGLFIYAATAVRYILPKPGCKLSDSEILARVMAIVADRPVSEHLGNAEILMDTLYKQIIVEALEDPGTDVFKLRRNVLDTIAIAREPISADTILQLTYGANKSHDVQAVENAIGALHAVLTVSQQDHCVYINHTSFLDCLLDLNRAGEQLVCQQQAQHGVIAWQCFEIMNSSLHFNMCALPSSYLLDADVQGLKQVVRERFNGALRYSCLWWTDHWIAGWEDELESLSMNMLQQFADNKALFWIEAMNLLETGRRSYETMKRLREWCVKEAISSQSLLRKVNALERLTESFTGSPARLSTSHLYMSILATEIAIEKVPRTWKNYFPRLPKVTHVNISNQSGARMKINTGSAVNTVSFSVDGFHIVSGLEDNTICIWDAATGEKVRSLEGHTGNVSSVAFSHDGSHIISGSYDTSVRIWDVSTGINLQILEGHTDAVRSVALSTDGSRIVSGSDDKTVCIWDVNSGVNMQTLTGHTDYVLSVAYSNDGLHIASGSCDCTVRIWGARTGVSVQTLKGHQEWIQAVAFSLDDSRIISCSNDLSICIWDVITGAKLQTLEDHTGCMLSVAISSHGSHIVSGSDNNNVCIWDASSGVKLQTLQGHNNDVLSVAFSKDSSRIVSGSKDQTICVWDANSGVDLQAFQAPKNSVNSVAYSNDSSQIVSGSDDHTVCIWDAKTGVCLQTLEGHTGSVQSVALSMDGTLIVSGSGDRTIRMWDAKTGVNLQILEGHNDDVNSVAVSKDGSRIVSGSDDETLHIWDANTGEILRTLEGHTKWILCVAFSNDSSLIASGSGDQTVCVWDAITGVNLQTLKGHMDEVRSVAFSNDGICIISGSDDHTVRIWDARTGVNCQTLKGHKDSVHSVAFSKDNSRIVSGSRDKTICIWDAKTGDNLQTLEGHTDSVLSVAFSNDGSHIVSGSWDKAIRIWDANPQINVATFRDPSNNDLLFPSKYLFTSPEKDSGWLFDCDSSHPNRIMWLPPLLFQNMPIYPCLNILSRFGRALVTYDPDAVGSNWMNCYNPTSTN